MVLEMLKEKFKSDIKIKNKKNEGNFIDIVRKVFKNAEEMDENWILLDRKIQKIKGFDFDYTTIDLSLEKNSANKITVMIGFFDEEGDDVNELNEYYGDEIKITYKNSDDLVRQLKTIQTKM